MAPRIDRSRMKVRRRGFLFTPFRPTETYNHQPLLYAALASQKNHMAVYLMGIYSSGAARQEFETAYKATGKRFDVGQSCVRFRAPEDLPLDLIGETIASMAPDKLIALSEAARAGTKRKRSP